MRNLQLSRQDAARELLRRRTARRSLIEFTRFTLPKYDPAAHHTLIAEKLEAAASGQVDRLMVNMPPRHGKSELASRRFPAWLLGINPEIEIVVASYNADKAREFGYEVRDIVRSSEYRALFPNVGLKQDSKAADRWNTDAGGSFRAVGIGTALTGRGADVLLIDDPIKDDEEADSELRRERIWAWYSSVAYTRLSAGGRVIVIQTRWHEDDLTGRLLTEQAKGGDKWTVLELPAISSDGRALWPDRFPVEYLKRIKRVTLPRHWSALYQQRPAPEEGAYFKKDWFRFYDTKPKHLRIYGASDYAVTDGGGDFTVHLVVGVDPDDNIHVLDLWKGQTTSDQWVAAWVDLVRQYQPLMWVEEQGQIIKSIGPFLEKRMREEKVYCRREQVTSAADKPTRSRSIQARAAMGKVYLPSKSPWLADFLQELTTFPAGRHDDQVDTVGLIGRMLDELVPASLPKTDPTPKRDGYSRAQDRNEDTWRSL
jgi:predicted phage terminase large subunit-like protein